MRQRVGMPCGARSWQDLLVVSKDRRCLAEEGKVYVLQLRTGRDSAHLKLDGARFEMTWFDPVQGVNAGGSIKQLDGGDAVSVGVPPYGLDRDWMWRWTPEVATCHQLCYANSQDLVHWTSAEGSSIDLPFTPDIPEVIVDDVASRGGLHNSRYQLVLDADGEPLIGYVKFDEMGCTQLYFARHSGLGWIRKQVSDWNFRWQFIGGGDKMSDGARFRMTGVSSSQHGPSPRRRFHGGLPREFFKT
ncbi:MAG: BNR-4 repeat-containing protein [Planctomycetota bacterium]